MISMAYPPPCGAAVLLTLSMGRGSVADAWRVLRRADDDFAAPDGAVEVASGDWSTGMFSVLDFAGLENGAAAWYRQDDHVLGAWVPGEPVSVVPQFVDEALFEVPDLAGLMRDRLAQALRASVASGRLRHALGAIPVLTAHPQIDAVTLPVVTVILESRRSEVRGIGEEIIPDLWDGEQWNVFEGWMDRSVVQIGVWALNHADRCQLRDVVQRVVLLNLPVLDAAGFVLPDLSESDLFDADSYGAPVYQTVITLSCLHPALVRARLPAIREVLIDAQAT